MTTALTQFTLINGQVEDSISVADRGLLYGDGFFTTALIQDSALLNWSAHLRRLRQSADRLDYPVLDEARLNRDIVKIVEAFTQAFQLAFPSAAQPMLILKVILTRGSAGRGYAIPEQQQPTLVLQISQAPEAIQSKFIPISVERSDASKTTRSGRIKVGICQTFATIQPQLAGIKHLNRLENVLARTEVEQAGWQEGVMLNSLDQVVSGTQSNLFIIKGSQLITPTLDLSGVEGTTRYHLKAIVDSLGLSWHESDLSMEAVLQADELFFTNALRGVMSVEQLVIRVPKLNEQKSIEYGHIQTDKINQAWLNALRHNRQKIIA
ncbi:MAG: aminodeoxychorismate lyase [Gammaproteobacteria bacterium]|nr:aminodeoxychorismate lyase [Gammaproteobacteria bacterium]